MKSMRNLCLAALGALALAACGGGQTDTSMPLNEARNLNSDLTTSYVRATQLLEQATASTQDVGTLPTGVDGRDFDVAMFRQVLEACFTETVSLVPGANIEEVPRRAEAELGPATAPLTERPAVGRVQACNPPRMLALETYLGVVAPELRTFLEERTLQVDVLRVHLKDVLIAQVDALERQQRDALAESARLRGVAEQRRALAQSSDVDEEQRRTAEADYDAVIAELESVDAVLGELEDGIGEMRRLRRQLVDDAVRNIAALGTDD